MDSVNIKNAQGEQTNVNVVRYFRLNGTEYLVFSLNEVDEGGYVKLYISKVDGNNANTITDDVEWNLIKDTIKTIIKSNKENMPLSIIDLDVRKLGNLQINDQKVFKLSETFIELLSANKNVEPYVEPIASVPSNEIAPAESDFEVSEFDMTAIQPNPIMQNDFVQSIESNVQNDVLPQFDSYVDDASASINVSDDQNMKVSSALEDIQSIIANLEVPATHNVQNDNQFASNPEYSLDYKKLYDNEIEKNKMLMEELEKYKSIINCIKNMINQ